MTSTRRRPDVVRMYTMLSCVSRSRATTSGTPISRARKACSKYAELPTLGVSTTTVGSDRPLGRRDDARQQVVGEYPLRSRLVAVHREGAPLREERPVGFRLVLPQLRQRRGPRVLDERLAVRPRLPGGGEHLVVGVVQEVAGERRAGRRRRSR